jgi:hypothetical protein
MNSVRALYLLIKASHPEIAKLADKFHHRRWGATLEEDFEYAWFEALADALNEQMRMSVPAEQHANLLQTIASAFGSGDRAVKECVDVSFIENLFWQVPDRLAQAYWHQMPKPLAELYLTFHGKQP